MPAMTLWPPGAWPPERMTATFTGLPSPAPPALNFRSGMLLVDGKRAAIFSASANAASGAPFSTFTDAPERSAGGSFGAYSLRTC